MAQNHLLHDSLIIFDASKLDEMVSGMRDHLLVFSDDYTDSVEAFFTPGLDYDSTTNDVVTISMEDKIFVRYFAHILGVPIVVHVLVSRIPVNSEDGWYTRIYYPDGSGRVLHKGSSSMFNVLDWSVFPHQIILYETYTPPVKKARKAKAQKKKKGEKEEENVAPTMLHFIPIISIPPPPGQRILNPINLPIVDGMIAGYPTNVPKHAIVPTVGSSFQL